MTTVYIIRHAEAEGNLYRRIHGWYDSKLTDQGLRQVEALKKRFENIRIDAVYSSDRQRTKATARAILDGRDLELHETSQFREFGMGAWEDRTWGDIQKYDIENYLFFNRDPAKFHAEGAEDHYALQTRMLNAVKAAAAENEGKTIAIFSHGAAIRALLARILNVPSERIQEIAHGDNTSVTKLLVDGDNITVEYMGDSAHLNGMTRTKRQMWLKNGGIDISAMRFEPVDFDKDINEYSECRKELGFDERSLNIAKTRSETDKDLVAWAICSDNKAGLIELSQELMRDGTGIIDFYYMMPEYRGKMLAVQLLGYAVSYFRKYGCKKLKITIPERYNGTVGFFEHFGFEKVSVDIKETILEKEI